MPYTAQNTPQTRKHWELDFEYVRNIVGSFGTPDDTELLETMLGVYYDQSDDPSRWPDSVIEQETARRLGKKPNAFYQQLRRMRARTKHNVIHYML